MLIIDIIVGGVGAAPRSKIWFLRFAFFVTNLVDDQPIINNHFSTTQVQLRLLY